MHDDTIRVDEDALARTAEDVVTVLRKAAARIGDLEARVRELEALLREVIEPGVFGEWHSVIDPAIPPEFSMQCTRYGYGAVMSHVEALWRAYCDSSPMHPTSGAEHTVAACASVRRGMIEKIKAALPATGGDCNG